MPIFAEIFWTFNLKNRVFQIFINFSIDQLNVINVVFSRPGNHSRRQKCLAVYPEIDINIIVLVNRIFSDFQMQFNWFAWLGGFFDNFNFKLLV